MKILPLIFALCAGCAVNAQDASPRILALAHELISRTTPLAVPKEPSAADIGEARLSASQKVAEWSLEGVVTLLGETEQADFLELLWWKHSTRSVRLLIVAAFLCRAVEPRAEIPAFEIYAKQFKDDEARDRLEEVTFVQTHLSAFAQHLMKITDGVTRVKDLREQYASVARMKVGSELPKR